MQDEAKLIYVADDDENIRVMIRTFIQSGGYGVECFPDGESLLKRFQEKPCDLIILDVMMPGTDGFEICRRIRAASTVPVIFLTARDTDSDFALGIGLGGDDYITKPFSGVALLMRIRAIFRRIDMERNHTGEAKDQDIKAGALSLDEGRRVISCDGEILALTPTEYAVLRYLMLHAGEAVSREELLSDVWGFETEVETRATDDTVRRLRKKLSGKAVSISAVWGYGFRLEAKP